jgi:PAS domain S-box-containing protein
MENVVVALALVVAVQYLVIAVVVVPKLARIATTERRLVTLAQCGATAFFFGCAITHTMIALQTLDPDLVGGMDMSAQGGTQALLWEMVVPHLAQVFGGAVFIFIAVNRLEVSITSKEQASELRVLNRQMQSAFERAPLGFSLMVGHDQASRAVYVNPAYFEIFGLDPRGPLPSREDLLDRVHPDDRPQSEVTTSNDVIAGGVVEHEFRVIRPDGVVRWVHSRLSPAADEDAGAGRLTVVVEDITDRVNAQHALERSERRFTQLANSVNVGISLRQLDPPELLWVNAAYADIVGNGLSAPDGDIGAQDASGYDDPADVLLHPDDRERVLGQYWPRAQAGEVVESEHRVLRPDGAIRWVHVTSNPVLDDDGEVTRVAGTVEDITVRKNAEEAVRDAQAAAERANNMRTEFLSRVSHELRTPLNAVLGFGQLLELDELLPEQQDAVAHILRGGRHLLTLINDVIDISHIQADEVDVCLEPVAVDELLSDVAGLMLPTAVANDVTLRRDDPLDPDLSTHVLACPRRLQQVLLNLLSNAIKFNTAAGSVRLHAQAGTPGRLRISVSDTGVGIRATDLSRLLVPFDRLGQESSDIEGAGIGLALTDRLVQAMGGELEIESTFGLGSTFSVSLPTVTTDTVPGHDERAHTCPQAGPKAGAGPCPGAAHGSVPALASTTTTATSD